MSDVYQAHFLRYAVDHYEERDTLREAVALLAFGEDAGTLASVGIVMPDGTEQPFTWPGYLLGGEPLPPEVTAGLP